MDTNQPGSLFEMQADSETQSQLNTISKWTRFISVTALIVILFAGVAFIMAREEIMDHVKTLISYNDNLAGAFIGIMIALCGMVLVWMIFLLRASVLIKQGLMSRNSERLAEGFKALRIFFVLSMVLGILTMIGTISDMINI